MPVTPFKAMEFKKNDVVTLDAMDQMQANYQWIVDNTPRGQFVRLNGDRLSTRNVLVGGRVRIKRNKKEDTASARVRLGRSFSPECRPHVTTGVVSDFQRRIFCVVNGPQGINYPTSAGFDVRVNVASAKKKRDKIQKSFWVHWHAYGYRTDDMNEF